MTRMCLRALDSVEMRPLAGTESGNALPPPVFWSPDSRFIAFSFTQARSRRASSRSSISGAGHPRRSVTFRLPSRAAPGTTMASLCSRPTTPRPVARVRRRRHGDPGDSAGPNAGKPLTATRSFSPTANIFSTS